MAKISLDSADHPKRGAFTVTAEFGQFLAASLSTTFVMIGLGVRKKKRFLQHLPTTRFGNKYG